MSLRGNNFTLDFKQRCKALRREAHFGFEHCELGPRGCLMVRIRAYCRNEDVLCGVFGRNELDDLDAIPRGFQQQASRGVRHEVGLALLEETELCDARECCRRAGKLRRKLVLTARRDND